jgi:hypothetical protein
MGSNLVLTWLPADSTLAPPVPVNALSSLMLAITVGVTDIIGARIEVHTPVWENFRSGLLCTTFVPFTIGDP